MLRALLLVATLLASACATGTANGADWSYDVRFDEGGDEMHVAAAFERPGTRTFAVADGLAPWVADVAWWDGERWHELAPDGDVWRLPQSAPPSPELRYRVRLRAAADAGRRPELVSERTGVLEARPAAWMLRPRQAHADAVRFRVKPPPDQAFVTGVFRAPDGGPHAYELPSRAIGDAPFTAVGRVEVHRLSVRGAEIDVALAPSRSGWPEDEILAWIDEAARQIDAYFGRFPAPRVLVFVHPSRGRGIGVASASGNGGAHVDVPFGRHVRPGSLERDWVMAHELVHVASPNIEGPHDWLEEGLATYVEPVARCRTGDVTPQALWSELVRNLPEGQPDADDGGFLDGERSWGRTYWGGALFCLVADVELRRRTGNERGLEHALRAIARRGGHIGVTWTIDEWLEAAAEATGTRVLRELYDAMKDEPVRVDLEELWDALGVRASGSRIELDDDAPDAAIRRAIESGRE